jgi:hypothetical protein
MRNKENERIVASLEELKSFANLEFADNPTREKSLSHYFGNGGIIRMIKNETQEATVVYPTQDRLKNVIQTKSALKNNFQRKMSDWKKKLKEAESYHRVNEIKKFSNPLYWKHLAQYTTNKKYRDQAKAVKLPVALLNDTRYKPMVKMFVTDPDYRKQLSETVQESVVYSNNRKVAQFADNLQEFRKQECTRNIKSLEEKIKGLEKDVQSLQEIMKWSK